MNSRYARFALAAGSLAVLAACTPTESENTNPTTAPASDTLHDTPEPEYTDTGTNP